MNTELYNKCVNVDLQKLFEKKNYIFFTKGYYNLNIIGVRADNKNKITNKYDDILIVDYNTSKNIHCRKLFDITTEPGLYYIKHLINTHGCAILVPDQYRGCYSIGLHRGKYKALCQTKPVKVYRDNNKDDIYDMKPSTIDKGNFGINIHRSHQSYMVDKIDKYSAGCQVFNNPKNYTTFINLCEAAKSIYGNSFTYTLIEEKDLI